VGIHRKLQHPGKKPTKEFTQSSWENSKARLHREMNRGEIREEEEDEDEGKIVSYYSIVDSFYNPTSTATT
jgi:hypothetical protein